VALLAGLVGLATSVAVRVRGGVVGRWWALDLIVALLLATAVLATAVVVARVRHARSELAPAVVLARLTRVFRQPPGGWVAAAVGAIVTIPLWSLYWPVLSGDADSARLLSATRYLLDGHSAFEYFSQTQEPVLPPLVLAPVVTIGGLSLVKLVILLGVQAMAAVTSFITFRITRSMWGATAAATSLLCLTAVTERATRLPFYGPMLACGYLGGWYAYRALTDRQFTWRVTVVSAVLLVLAQEFHGVGQLFLAAPLLVAVLVRDRAVRRSRLVRLYAMVAVAMVPRVLLNLSVDGLRSVTSPRADYWITEGYVVEIQNRFLLYEGVSEPRLEYLGALPERFMSTLGPAGWVVVVLAVAALLLALGGRGRAFVLTATGFLVLALTVKRVPPFARYYALAWPGLAVLAGVAVAALARLVPGDRGARGSRWLPAAATAVLAVPAFATLSTARQDADEARQLADTITTRAIVNAVDDGRGVIGARATQRWFSVGTDVPVWGDQFLTEDEYVTYLTWPSDRAVLDVLRRHDIGWVYITDARHLELTYNDIWLKPFHGMKARHVARIAQSPFFCPWRQVGLNIVYRVGACPDPPPAAPAVPVAPAAPERSAP
jgi:hypothetical protein